MRKTGRAGIEVPVGKNLVLNASYAREMRDGNKNTTFYGGPDYEVATPIDFTTDNFHFGGDYAKGRFFLGASVDVSQFKNNVPFVEIDNPERLEMSNPTNGRAVVNDVEFFRLWMYPDNDAWQADFTGGFTLAKRHKLTASISTGNMSMEMPLQHNISTNPNLQTSATTPTAGSSRVVPPYGNIAAEYDTFMANVKLTGDPRQLARLHGLLAQVRARRQDRGLQLHQHRPRRHHRVLQRRLASRASIRAGASRPGGRRLT